MVPLPPISPGRHGTRPSHSTHPPLRKQVFISKAAANVDEAVQTITANPNIGERKKGDLSQLFVYKFRSQNQLYLLGYTSDDSVRQRTLLNLGTQFNFPREQWHDLTHRVEGHIFITLLAYNLALQIRCWLKGQGIDDSWVKIRITMRTQVRVTTSLRGERCDLIHVRKSCRPSADQQILLRALRLEWLPGRTEKTVVTS